MNFIFIIFLYKLIQAQDILSLVLQDEQSKNNLRKQQDQYEKQLLVVSNDTQIINVDVSEKEASKWRCSFVCGPSTSAESTINCDEIDYSFFLKDFDFINKETYENKMSDACQNLFDNITSVEYLNSVRVCNQTSCAAPESLALLPPDDYFINQESHESKKPRPDPLVLAQASELDVINIKKEMINKAQKFNDEQILQALDEQIIKTKDNICSQDTQKKQIANLVMERFQHSLSEENMDTKNQSIKNILFDITKEPMEIIEQYVNSMDDNQSNEIIDQFQLISQIFKNAAIQCDSIEQIK